MYKFTCSVKQGKTFHFIIISEKTTNICTKNNRKHINLILFSDTNNVYTRTQTKTKALVIRSV